MVVIFPVENCKSLIPDLNFPAGATPENGPFLGPQGSPRGPQGPSTLQKRGQICRGLLGTGGVFERTRVPRGPKGPKWGSGVTGEGAPPRDPPGPPFWALIPLESTPPWKIWFGKSQFPHKTPQLNWYIQGPPLGCTKNGPFWGPGPPPGTPPRGAPRGPPRGPPGTPPGDPPDPPRPPFLGLFGPFLGSQGAPEGPFWVEIRGKSEISGPIYPPARGGQGFARRKPGFLPIGAKKSPILASFGPGGRADGPEVPMTERPQFNCGFLREKRKTNGAEATGPTLQCGGSGGPVGEPERAPPGPLFWGQKGPQFMRATCTF